MAEFCAGLTSSDIPSNVQYRARLLLLDALAIAVRGAHDGDSTQALLQGLAATGSESGPCVVVGTGSGFGAGRAAAINGAFIHTLDFDDTHIGASAHITAPVVPAALAAAQVSAVDGARAVTGIIAGIEVMTRLGRALVPPRHYARGYHPTATCGTFGAAAAAGVVLQLNPEQMANAFGIALSSAGGTLQFHANGAWTKRLQVGLASEAGVRAAFLARAGFRGAAAAIEGERGLLAVFTDEPNPNCATKGLGQIWETLEIGVKPYPACRFAHAAIDAILHFIATENITPDNVERIQIGLSKKAIAAVAEPEPRKRHAANIVDAQFSVYFLAAAALLTGGVRWDDYPGLLGRPDVNALADRVVVWHDPKIEALYPRRMAASVAIVSDGRMLEYQVDSPSGEPDSFPDLADLVAKAHSLVAPVLGEEGAERFCNTALEIETTGVETLMTACLPEPV
ncbi:MAG: MmgE/PrpD family protein [Novosphingobium sp.]